MSIIFIDEVESMIHLNHKNIIHCNGKSVIKQKNNLIKIQFISIYTYIYFLCNKHWSTYNNASGFFFHTFSSKSHPNPFHNEVGFENLSLWALTGNNWWHLKRKSLAIG